MNEYNENNFLRDTSMVNKKVSINRSFVSDKQQPQQTKSITDMAFNNSNEEVAEEEITIRASDIILLPFNPEGGDNIQNIASNEQNQTTDESMAKKKKGKTK